MKSETACPVPRLKELVFPCLARHKKENYICLFKGSREATVVVDCDTWGLGYYSAIWSDVSHEDIWEILPAGFKVTLTQE